VKSTNLSPQQKQRLTGLISDWQSWLLDTYPDQAGDERFRDLTLVAFFSGYESGFCDEWSENPDKPVQRVAVKAFMAGNSAGHTRAVLWVKE